MNARKIICLFLHILTLSSPFNINLLTSSIIINLNELNTKFKVYENGTSNNIFKFLKDSDISDCSSKSIYHESMNKNQTKFEIILENDEKIQRIIVKSDNKNIDTIYKLSGNSKNYSKNNDKYFLEVNHTCRDFTSRIRNYWGIIEIEIYNSLESKVKFEFIKFCDQPLIIGSVFTMIILFLISTVFITASTYSELRIEENSQPNSEGEIKYWHGIILIVLGSVLLILIFYFNTLIYVLFTILIVFQISFAYYLCLKTFYEFMGLPNKFEILNCRKKICGVEIKLYSLIILLITIITVIIYFKTKHWILNNIFAFCLVFTIMAVFHVRSFKICSVILTSAFLYDVFWVYLSPLFFGDNVMVLAASTLNLPIKLEIPIVFNTHPFKTCIFLGLGDLVIPGFVLKFCHRFDFLKKSKIYYITSLILYMTALGISGVMMVFTRYPQPVLFYMCPVLLIGIYILAYLRGELVIWNADKLEEQINFNSIINEEAHTGTNTVI